MRLNLSWAFKYIRFYDFLVALGVFVVISIGYMELQPHCKDKAVTRQIRAFVEPFKCDDYNCSKKIFDRLYEEKKQDYCKYLNYGNL